MNKGMTIRLIIALTAFLIVQNILGKFWLCVLLLAGMFAIFQFGILRNEEKIAKEKMAKIEKFGDTINLKSVLNKVEMAKEEVDKLDVLRLFTVDVRDAIVDNIDSHLDNKYQKKEKVKGDD